MHFDISDSFSAAGFIALPLDWEKAAGSAETTQSAAAILPAMRS
jgi:hypothetical protein